MGTFTFQLQGTRDLNTALARLIEHALPDAAARELYQVAEEIMAASKELVPVDTGTLMGTGHVDLPTLTDDQIAVVLSYGGPAAPYAVAVHEIPPPPFSSPGGRSATHHPPRSWKYLEIPVLAARDRVLARLQARLADTMRRR